MRTIKYMQKNQGKLSSRKFELIRINECVQMDCFMYILSEVLKARQFLIKNLTVFIESRRQKS